MNDYQNYNSQNNQYYQQQDFNNSQNNQYQHQNDFNNLQNNQFQQNNLNYLNNNYPLQNIQEIPKKKVMKRRVNINQLMKLRGMNRIKSKNLF